MNSKMYKLNNTQLELVTGGGGIGGGRDPVLPDPIGGNGYLGDGNPYGVIGIGGRDWWTLPGDLVIPVPILKPEPGKP